MIKQIKVAFLALFAVAALASCGDNETEAQQAANAAVETATPVQPTTAATTPDAPAAPAGPTTTMTFKETTFDFGSVPEGEKVSHTYNFTNTGNEPLILSNAKGSCGCTVPKWPKEPIAPGESGEIVVEFNSKNKKGKRNQKVTITANTDPAQTFIYLTGEVQPGEGAADVKVTQ